MRTNFGSFFVSLADIARVRSQGLPSRHLRENIRALERPNFRSDGGEGFSSSPIKGSASSRGHEKIARMLLNKGAKVNAQCGFYGTDPTPNANFRSGEGEGFSSSPTRGFLLHSGIAERLHLEVMRR